ncbi:hypothetical protein CAAN1_14S01354 [[Candida] anglica]|uniref:Uncharacterized protein n=1 Tax=[Candida] anglica TaxID=148631 RepID=A0ABP0EIT5_9ASCO
MPLKSAHAKALMPHSNRLSCHSNRLSCHLNRLLCHSNQLTLRLSCHTQIGFHATQISLEVFNKFSSIISKCSIVILL